MTGKIHLSTEDSKFLTRMFTLSLPIVLQEGLNALVNMVSNFMVGSLGLHSVTAVGLANLVFFMYAVVLFGVSSGSAIYIGQFWGKKDIKNIHKTMGLALCTGLTFASVVTTAVIFFAPQIMSFYTKSDTEVIRLGVTYLHSVVPVYVLIVFIGVINISLRSIGRTRLPLISTMVGLSCNVTLHAIFILVLDRGVAGAAQATVIARSVELLTQIFMINKLKLPILGRPKDYFAFDKTFAKGYYVLVIPVVLNEFFWALGTTLYSVIYQTTGTEGQGAAQIASTVQNLFVIMGMAVGSGCAIMISNALGAGERELAIKYSRKALVVATIISAVMSVLLIGISPIFISFYSVPDEVKALAFKICMVIAAGMVIKTINFTNIIGILRSGGDTKFCLVVDGMTVWAVALPCLALGAFVLHWPVYGLVALTYSEEIVKLALCMKRTLSNRWARNLVENV